MSAIELVNLLQRASGIIAIGLIALQIYLGATRKALRFHRINGIVAYTFVLLHPVFMVVMNYLVYGKMDFFYPFVDVCLLCPSKVDTFVNLGRIGFWLITIGVFAARFRKISNWLDLNWRKLHILNYFAFYFISSHAINLGSDSKSIWFTVYFSILQIVVIYSIIVRLRRLNPLEYLKKILYK